MNQNDVTITPLEIDDQPKTDLEQSEQKKTETTPGKTGDNQEHTSTAFSAAVLSLIFAVTLGVSFLERY